MRLLFVSLEFSAQPFSGNGIYALSQVRALSALGHEMLVLSGKPAGHGQPPQPCGAAALHEVELPVWGRVDRASAYAAFAEGCRRLAPLVRVFQPLVALGVDWTARRAVKAATAECRVPYIYLNYRVFLRSCLPADVAFYQAEESQAAAAADLTVVLCPSDAAFVAERLLPGQARPPPQVLLPCLRSDMAQMPLLRRERRFLTCCVRLSPEKEPERFVALVEALQTGGHLDRLQVTPLLCASTATGYADSLRARFRAAAPGAQTEDRFLGPSQLAEVFAATRLNFHPPSSEAFGMTVVEAASQEAPSVVNAGDAVGATALLQPGSEVLQLDYGLPPAELAAQIAALLEDPSALAVVGRAAASRARSWGEAANAARLVELLENALTQNQPQCVEPPTHIADCIADC